MLQTPTESELHRVPGSDTDLPIWYLEDKVLVVVVDYKIVSVLSEGFGWIGPYVREIYDSKTNEDLFKLFHGIGNIIYIYSD